MTQRVGYLPFGYDISPENARERLALHGSPHQTGTEPPAGQPRSVWVHSLEDGQPIVYVTARSAPEDMEHLGCPACNYALSDDGSLPVERFLRDSLVYGRRLDIESETRAQPGRENEDHVVRGREPVPWVALLDGAGNAHGCAKRAGRVLRGWIQQASPSQIRDAMLWQRMAWSLDSLMNGGPETTLTLVFAFGGIVAGITLGDNRVHVVPGDGSERTCSGRATKARLGSGEADPTLIWARLDPHDVLVLATDGAWGPLGLKGVERVVRASFTRRFDALPGHLLDEAAKRGGGLCDDATVVTVRVR